MDGNSITMLLFRLTENITRYFANPVETPFKVNASGSGISERQYYILFSIEYFGADTLGALAQRLCISASGLSTVVSKMADSGLLLKRAFPKGRDGRMVVFEITSKGGVALKATTEEILRNIKRFRSRLNEKELDDFLEGYRLISKIVTGREVKINPGEGFAEDVFRGHVEFKRWLDTHAANDFKRGDKLLSPEQFRMLVLIKDFGADSISDMSAYTGLSGSAVSIALKNLADAGYIRKEKSDENDGRRLKFFITEHGSDALNHKKEMFISRFTEFYETLENPKLFYEALERLNSVFQSLNQNKSGGYL